MTPEEYVKMHQKAFRVAFDYLSTHFPPDNDPQWWEQSARELSEASILADESDLALELLTAVFTYLGHEYERRRKDNETEH